MDDDEEMWTSPAATPAHHHHCHKSHKRDDGGGGGDGDAHHHQQEADDATRDPEAGLRRELAGVRAINEAVEGMLATLERTRTNMSVSRSTAAHGLPSRSRPRWLTPPRQTVSGTIGDASTLLSTWTRILSQTEHNQRLILDPAWRGATHDVAELEAEAARQQLAQQQQQQLAERRAYEEQQQRRREEEERRRAAAERGRGGVADARGRRAGAARGRGRPSGIGRGAAGRGAASAAAAAAGQQQHGEGGVVRSRSIIGRGVARYRPRGSR
jgi:hypothetical protein